MAEFWRAADLLEERCWLLSSPHSASPDSWRSLCLDSGDNDSGHLLLIQAWPSSALSIMICADSE